jgi:hypothetical protein
VLGGGLVVTGLVWILQGLGFLEGSFMTGQTFWTWMGALAVLLGAAILARALRRG